MLRVHELAKKTYRLYRPIDLESAEAASLENAVITFTEASWDVLPVARQHTLFGVHTIHLLEGRKVMPGFRKWSDTDALAEYITLDTPRFVHGKQVNIGRRHLIIS